MLIWYFRAIFIIVVVGVIFLHLSTEEVSETLPDRTTFFTVLVAGLALAIFFFLLDTLTPKRKLSAIAGVFFGLLVGMLISYALSPVVNMVVESYNLEIPQTAINAIKWILGISVCYLTISIVMRTKDDVRFVIPYVAFSKQTKGARPLVLDTSVIIDGRIADLCRSKLFDAPIIIPRFVLNELQLIADSADRLKRNRGRRGLDILRRLQENPDIDVEIDDSVTAEVEEVQGVDQKLIVFARNCNGRLATTDYNLNKVAQVRGIDIVNVNELANSLKTTVLPGETMDVKIIKPGEEADQGIGYLDDGTMIVVESARDKIGREVTISITSSIQTSAGKMVFGKYEALVNKRAVNKVRTS